MKLFNFIKSYIKGMFSKLSAYITERRISNCVIKYAEILSESNSIIQEASYVQFSIGRDLSWGRKARIP